MEGRGIDVSLRQIPVTVSRMTCAGSVDLKPMSFEKRNCGCDLCMSRRRFLQVFRYALMHRTIPPVPDF